MGRTSKEEEEPEEEEIIVSEDEEAAEAPAKDFMDRINPDSLKVDGVAYTKGQAEREGWSLVF